MTDTYKWQVINLSFSQPHTHLLSALLNTLLAIITSLNTAGTIGELISPNIIVLEFEAKRNSPKKIRLARLVQRTAVTWNWRCQMELNQGTIREQWPTQWPTQWPGDSHLMPSLSPGLVFIRQKINLYCSIFMQIYAAMGSTLGVRHVNRETHLSPHVVMILPSTTGSL